MSTTNWYLPKQVYLKDGMNCVPILMTYDQIIICSNLGHILIVNQWLLNDHWMMCDVWATVISFSGHINSEYQVSNNFTGHLVTSSLVIDCKIIHMLVKLQINCFYKQVIDNICHDFNCYSSSCLKYIINVNITLYVI